MSRLVASSGHHDTSSEDDLEVTLSSSSSFA
jgi:hypothetical protein